MILLVVYIYSHIIMIYVHKCMYSQYGCCIIHVLDELMWPKYTLIKVNKQSYLPIQVANVLINTNLTTRTLIKV